MATETTTAGAATDESAEAKLAEAVAAAAQPADSTPIQRQLVVINWSGEFDKVLPTLIMSSVAAASGYKTSVFLTFWGLLPFVKDKKRITGDGMMQKMLSFMQRPGISHMKMSKMNFMGMGPWMIGKLSDQYNVASPQELLEACQLMGVDFLPCQMTMDMFGLKREDMIDGLGDPVGAATVLELMTEDHTGSLFI
ncbi:MAG: DsrE/DsrF/DrsH-like family protein [Chloroflexota bacterium]|nr:DsrE/DsrF/DrsH-like family protein [Chloroflexota bacterium]